MQITPANYNNAKQHLLAAAMELAPDGKVQAGFNAYVQNMEADGSTPQQILRCLTGAIYDGIAYGNWTGENNPTGA